MEEKIRLAVFGQKRLSREGGIEIVVKELCTRMALYTFSLLPFYNKLCLFSTIFSPVSCFLHKNTIQSSPNISSAQSESLLLGESVSQEYWKSPFFLRPRHP